MMRALEAFAEFKHHGLKPEDDYVAEHRRGHEAVVAGAPRQGDHKVLSAMADVISALLVTREGAVVDNSDDPALLSEQVTWTWHTYSGLAHGYAWPWLLPGTTEDRAMPGDYLADLGIVVGVTHLAFEKTLERLQQPDIGE